MSRIRAVFMGTPEIARDCLSVLVKDPRFEVVGVVSQPDRPAGRKLQLQPSAVKAFALTQNLPVLTPEKVSEENAFAPVKAWGAEVAVVVAYGQILRPNVLEAFPNRVVNVHASLLPRWRGAAPIQRALMAGDAETGVCLQVMVRGLDAGPVLGARPIPLPPAMNAADLYAECARLGAQLLGQELVDYLRGHLTPVPQDEAAVTLAPKISKAETLIDWRQDASVIHNRVRGLALGPFAHSLLHRKPIKIHRTRVGADGADGHAPGEVLRVSDASLVVKCGTGSLDLLELQPESRAKMLAPAFLRGYKINVGDVFGSAGGPAE